MKKLTIISLMFFGTFATAYATPAPDAPEIDASSIGAASALICSIVLMTRSRRKR